jgi:hypothetical protein
MPFGTIQAMKRRGATQLAALAFLVQMAEGKKGRANVAVAPPRNNLRDFVNLMRISWCEKSAAG